MIRLIAAIDSQRGIATDSGIPWKLPGDTAYFREKTANGLIVMGRATYDEFAAPLHGRENYVLSTTHDALAHRLSGHRRPRAAPGGASGRRHLGHRRRHRVPGDDRRGGGTAPDAGAEGLPLHQVLPALRGCFRARRAGASTTTRPASPIASRSGEAASRTQEPPAGFVEACSVSLTGTPRETAAQYAALRDPHLLQPAIDRTRRTASGTARHHLRREEPDPIGARVVGQSPGPRHGRRGRRGRRHGHDRSRQFGRVVRRLRRELEDRRHPPTGLGQAAPAGSCRRSSNWRIPPW